MIVHIKGYLGGGETLVYLTKETVGCKASTELGVYLHLGYIEVRVM